MSNRDSRLEFLRGIDLGVKQMNTILELLEAQEKRVRIDQADYDRLAYSINIPEEEQFINNELHPRIVEMIENDKLYVKDDEPKDELTIRVNVTDRGLEIESENDVPVQEDD